MCYVTDINDLSQTTVKLKCNRSCNQRFSYRAHSSAISSFQTVAWWSWLGIFKEHESLSIHQKAHCCPATGQRSLHATESATV